MSALPHIGTTARTRRALHQVAERAHQHAATADERELHHAIERARHAPMFAAADDAPHTSRGLVIAARIALAITALLCLAAGALVYVGGTP